MHLLVVRHARAVDEDHDDPDPGLSPLGTVQAIALASRLTTLSPTIVLHGPRRRAVQTARILADAIGVPLEETPDLDDRTPVPSPAHRNDYAPHRWGWLDAVPEAERDVDGIELTAAWSRLRARAEGETAVLVTHAFVVGWFVTCALDAPPATWMRLPVSNTGLTVFDPAGPDGPVLERFNDIGHLAEVVPRGARRR